MAATAVNWLTAVIVYHSSCRYCEWRRRFAWELLRNAFINDIQNIYSVQKKLKINMFWYSLCGYFIAKFCCTGIWNTGCYSKMLFALIFLRSTAVYCKAIYRYTYNFAQWNVLHSTAANGNQCIIQAVLVNGLRVKWYSLVTGDYYGYLTIHGCSSDSSNTSCWYQALSLPEIIIQLMFIRIRWPNKLFIEASGNKIYWNLKF